MLQVRSIAEVSQLIAEHFGGLRSAAEYVPLSQALGRALAQDIQATEYVPNFNRSTVDGYAVIAADVFGCSESIPALLTLAGESHMGQPIDIQLQKGQCVYVPTGAELPANADAMVMLENADDFQDGTIAIYKPAAPGANLIYRGDDVKPGQSLLPAGLRLTAADIGALAALGVSQISAARAPRVAIISTGDELVPVDEPLQAGQIRDVNAPMLAAAVSATGGLPDPRGILRDEQSVIQAAVEAAMDTSDMLLISGGTSVGVKDALPAVISALGELLVHGVAAKPGKPTILGQIHGKPVFGLPGNPVAAYFMFHILARPLLFHMQGAQAEERVLSAPLARAVSSNHGREEFVPVRLSDGLVHPIASKSGLITTLAGADGFIRIARDTEGLSRDEIVEVTLFER
jgi:molybdopterin molybdotransferase